MRVSYIRVSTVSQNEDRQIEALKKYNIEKCFIEKISGKDRNRPMLNEMLNFVRDGDTIYIHDLSRLGRNTKDLLSIVEELENKGINLVSNKENIDSSTATGRLMLTMIAAIAEFERENILERQAEGIAAAKAKGAYKGRQKVKVNKEQFESLLKQYNSRKISKVKFAAALAISRPTLDKLLKEREAKNEF